MRKEYILSRDSEDSRCWLSRIGAVKTQSAVLDPMNSGGFYV
jgi:hypothetical protein